MRYFIVYFGKDAVKRLVEDFNRPTTREEQGEEAVVMKVPGVGPRILKDSRGGAHRRTTSGTRRRNEQGVVRRASSSRRTRKDKENLSPTMQEANPAPEHAPGLLTEMQPDSPPPSYDVLSLFSSTTPPLHGPRLTSRWSASEAGHSWSEEAPQAEASLPISEKLRTSVRGLGGLGKRLRRRLRVGRDVEVGV